jgi:hypothetical protein
MYLSSMVKLFLPSTSRKHPFPLRKNAILIYCFSDETDEKGEVKRLSTISIAIWISGITYISSLCLVFYHRRRITTDIRLNFAGFVLTDSPSLSRFFSITVRAMISTLLLTFYGNLTGTLIASLLDLLRNIAL